MQRSTMTLKETAEYIGVCIDTMYKMVREKQIPHSRARRRILFRKETIDAWLSEQERMVITK